jgi:L-alanine-DL-glutamate epimerase-like enolase superfamily enzyme
LNKPYKIAYKEITDTEIVFLEIGLDNGVIGLGAANPFEEVVGESPQKTLANLQQADWQPWMGRNIDTYEALIEEAWRLFPHQPGTVAAIDIALHDAWAQTRGLPLVDLLGRKHDALPTSVTIGIKGVAETLAEAAEYAAMGFRALKVKTGLDPQEDAERMIRLHEVYGNSMRLRVDANQGYSFSQLQSFLQMTAQVPLEVMEQPLPAGKENELLALAEADRRVLCADESLLDEAAAIRLSKPPLPFGIFNIKLMKCGGIRSARQMAAYAATAGIQLFWGCNDESMASITAALHVAYSTANTRFLDLDGSFDLSRDFVEAGFYLREGMMYLSDAPGLGLKRLR